MSRRAFLRGAASTAAALVASAALGAQEDQRNTTGIMDQQAYRPVQLPPKPGAKPSMTSDQRDALEHSIHCQCGCGLDVYTCRTTDFTCSVSPAMHVDVMALVNGGYGAQEILAAFTRAYGEQVLMAPVKQGFNWLGYILPFGVLGGGAVLVTTLVKRWSTPTAVTTVPVPRVNATSDELARLDEALRSDDP